MTKKRFELNDFNNDVEMWELLNIQAEVISDLEDENKQLKQELQKIQDSFELNWTQNRVEFDKDKLYIKDNNTEIRLNDRNLSIKVYIPSSNEFYLFKYTVTGRSLMSVFVERYNSKGDEEDD